MDKDVIAIDLYRQRTILRAMTGAGCQYLPIADLTIEGARNLL
jgi:hypothetical protein